MPGHQVTGNSGIVSGCDRMVNRGSGINGVTGPEVPVHPRNYLRRKRYLAVYSDSQLPSAHILRIS